MFDSRTTTSPKETVVMEMFNPPHPGEIFGEDCLRPLKLSVTEAAIPRATFHRRAPGEKQSP